MNIKLLNLKEKIPFNKQKIFFGEYDGFQRYDIYHYNFTKIMERKMRQAFWTPEEISLIDDRQNFKKLPEHIQEILVNNILFQTLMDSAQNRGLDSILSEIVTESEWEALFKSQAYFELIHSLSYSHIVREMFSENATEIFDRLYQNEHILNRVNNEVNSYSVIKNLLNKGEFVETLENKELLLELLISIYFLEGLKFYVSFLVTYAINDSYQNSVLGVSNIIKLINYDEDLHVSVVGGLLAILKNDKTQGFSHLYENGWFENKAIQILKQVMKGELEWAEYLLSFGQIPSLTIEVIKEFMQWYGNDRLGKIGIAPFYKINNEIEIVNWFKSYKDINKDNTAQQETSALNYNIGTMVNDIKNKDLEKILNEIIKNNQKA